MRPIRSIAALAVGLVALGVAGCQRPSDTTTAVSTPTPLERTAPPTTTPASQSPQPTAPTGTPDPSEQTIVGVWPAKTLAQARELQDGADGGHQPWLLSAELGSTAYAQAELGLFGPVVKQGGPAAYQIRSHNGEWEATLYLAQPVRHHNGIWVVIRVGGPMS